MVGLILNKLYENECLINKLQNKNICLFYIEVSRPIITNNLPIFPANEIFGFKGTLVATDLATVNIARKTNNKKIFYVQDLEWVKNPDYFENRVDLLASPAITYIASGEDVQRGLAAWGTQAPIIRPVEFNKILNV
jgi:hypothetical protein